jgi:hypothetical protein
VLSVLSLLTSPRQRVPGSADSESAAIPFCPTARMSPLRKLDQVAAVPFSQNPLPATRLLLRLLAVGYHGWCADDAIVAQQPHRSKVFVACFLGRAISGMISLRARHSVGVSCCLGDT